MWEIPHEKKRRLRYLFFGSFWVLNCLYTLKNNLAYWFRPPFPGSLLLWMLFPTSQPISDIRMELKSIHKPCDLSKVFSNKCGTYYANFRKKHSGGYISNYYFFKKYLRRNTNIILITLQFVWYWWRLCRRIIKYLV